MDNSTTKKANSIRDVIRYLKKFNNALVVIYLDENIIDSPLFSSHIRDIALLHQAGLKVVIIPGARKRVDEILSSANIKWTYKDNIRITNQEAMPLIKMAAFDISNVVMTSLAANNITAIIGNWVRSRAKGIINGFDFGTAGEIETLQVEAINTVLNEGFIPIFPCIGWNSVGHPYNISTVSLAQQVAISLKADKLFYVMEAPTINTATYNVPEDFSIAENGDVPAMTVEEVEHFIKENEDCPQKQTISILRKSIEACKQGVTRVHIVDGKLDGVLPCEIFSDLGSGTMIYTNNYGKIRPMEQTDIPAVLRLMNPFIESGKLLPRTENSLFEKLNDYIVYEYDGGVRACSALHFYSDGQAEIAAVAVDENFAHMGIGPKMIKHLVEKAKFGNSKGLFILTTQAIDWFEKMGFELSTVESLPEERRKMWNPERNSKVLRIK